MEEGEKEGRGRRQVVRDGIGFCTNTGYRQTATKTTALLHIAREEKGKKDYEKPRYRTDLEPMTERGGGWEGGVSGQESGRAFAQRTLETANIFFSSHEAQSCHAATMQRSKSSERPEKGNGNGVREKKKLGGNRRQGTENSQRPWLGEGKFWGKRSIRGGVCG